MTPQLIESSSAMDEFFSALNGSSLIAVDTEFFRETTYYPKLALVQIATDSLVACIDPLAFDARPTLKKILCDPDITKIFHSCSQDLEVLFYYLGEIPAPIYDTQIANALLSSHHQIGYAGLVENELTVQLDKSQTRTNWLQRPLTDKQVQYAGDDVFYLYKLHQVLEKKLTDSDRKTWFAEDSKKLTDNDNFDVAVEKLWKRVKGATRLSRDKLAIVQAIAEWRETVAQQKDLTRRRVLSDDIVISMALDSPKDLASISIPQKFPVSTEEQQDLLAAINTAVESTEDSWPDNRFSILSNEDKSLLKSLQKLVNNKAEELNISSAIICSKKELEQLIVAIRNQQITQNDKKNSALNIVNGWRLQCIGQQLIKTVEDAIKITE